MISLNLYYKLQQIIPCVMIMGMGVYFYFLSKREKNNNIKYSKMFISLLVTLIIYVILIIYALPFTGTLPNNFDLKNMTIEEANGFIVNSGITLDRLIELANDFLMFFLIILIFAVLVFIDLIKSNNKIKKTST